MEAIQARPRDEDTHERRGERGGAADGDAEHEGGTEGEKQTPFGSNFQSVLKLESSRNPGIPSRRISTKDGTTTGANTAEVSNCTFPLKRNRMGNRSIPGVA